MKPEKGDVYSTNNFGDIVVLEYKSTSEVKVRFLNTGAERYVRNAHLKSGSITDPLATTVCGVGCLGEDIYKYDTKGAKYKTAYGIWYKMIERCYSEKGNRAKRYNYRVEVSPEWHTFSNFYRWFLLQRREDGWHLDKDILSKGLTKKIYSPETSKFIPADLNALLTFSNAVRGELPCGVHRDKRRTKPTYTAQVCDGTKNIIWLGTFHTIEDAFAAYKKGKLEVIGYLAEKNLRLGYICERMYQNLLDWNIEEYPE